MEESRSPNGDRVAVCRLIDDEARGLAFEVDGMDGLILRTAADGD